MGDARRTLMSRFRNGREDDDLRRGGDRGGTGRRAWRGSVQPGRDGGWRCTRAASFQEDLRRDGLRPGVWFAVCRHQRLGRGADSGSGRVAFGVRAGLLSQRAALWLRPADRRDCGQLCRGGGLLARVDGLFDHDADQREHVHLRSRGDSGRDRDASARWRRSAGRRRTPR